MDSVGVASVHIQKLNHPIKEIRERSLKLLKAKLHLGWSFEDELAGTRELIDALLAWFQTEKPALQREALELLLQAFKTKAGNYIAIELGVENILSTLNKIRHKIDQNSIEILEDLDETLRFLNTLDSEVNIQIPHLNLHSGTSSEGNGSSSEYYNLGLLKTSSKETSVSNEHIDHPKPNLSCTDGIHIILFPWVDLCSSDLKTMILIEDSLRVMKSTRRCCRFIRDVFLRDFPAEIFLNRPNIVKSLWAISDGQYGGHPEEAMYVLLSITKALVSRFSMLFSQDFVSQKYKISDDPRTTEDNVNIELEQFAGEIPNIPQNNNILVLRQMPAPIYALETAQAVITIMIRNIVMDVTNEINGMEMMQSNTCLCLLESLIEFLLKCVDEEFWSVEHTTKTQRDIAHKACMVMRMLGDLLTKYKMSFYKDPERIHHRISWFRLVHCAETLLHWARKSALPPSSLVSSLQAALIDPAVELLYPDLGKRISAVLMSAKSSVDREYKSKYRELNKLFLSIDYAVKFMKIKDSGRMSKDVLSVIKNALPVLHLNLNENYLKDMAEILLTGSKDLDFDDSDWSAARGVALALMAHGVEWVRATFYRMLCETVKSALVSDDRCRSENEKSLTLLCDVGILTEICCHGLCSSQKEVESSSSDIMVCVLRGRMVLSESRWWRLLASLLPVTPLLHAYAAHDTPLGRAICKSLEADIAECLGVSRAERLAALVRCVFVRCASVQLDAAHALCQLLDDSRYLPPRELLRADVILNALRRVEPQDFNVDQSTSPSKTAQTTGLVQILDVLKQDLEPDEHSLERSARARSSRPTLEPALRRSTLQQLAVLLRRPELHDAFLQRDGLALTVALLRLSLMVEDYLAFPECAISCVSVLNSVGFGSRHALAKISDLPLLLLRVILVFPANDGAVLLSAQLLALLGWAGFVLQELDEQRRRVPSLPHHVTTRTRLPFVCASYWATSPNADHSSVEWLLSEDSWRSAIRVRWWWASCGRAAPLRALPPSGPAPPPTPAELAALRASCPVISCSKHLLALENATSHCQVDEALRLLESYAHVARLARAGAELHALAWRRTGRFLGAPPASARDAALLLALLRFVLAYMDHVPAESGSMSWIKSYFIGSDATIISLLSRDRLYPQQTPHEDVELNQLRIHIVKVLIRCVISVEHEGDYSVGKMESLVKILLACLERIDLKNFHVLGYLNELIRCVRYTMHSRYCKLSEDTLNYGLRVMTYTLSGCASGAGRKGQACRLDAILSLLALLRQLHTGAIPVQRWSEVWEGNVVQAVVRCSGEERAELRAAALHVMAALAHYSQLLPQLTQCVKSVTLYRYAVEMFSREGEANAVRAAAACLLTALTARTSPQSQVSKIQICNYPHLSIMFTNLPHCVLVKTYELQFSLFRIIHLIEKQ